MRESLIKIHIDKELNAIQQLRTINKESVKKTSLTVFTKRFIINHSQPVLENHEFKKIITDSVNLLFDYTITPCATLMRDLFGELDSQKSLVIAKKLSQFRFYKYYPDTIINYIKDEDKVIVLNDEVQLLLKDTNLALYDKFIERITGVKIKNLFVQIFKLKYFSESRINLDSTVSKSMIDEFLSDKNYRDLKSRIDSIPVTGKGDEVSLKDIIKYLSGKTGEAPVTKENEDESITLTVEETPEIQLNANDELVEDDEVVIFDSSNDEELSVEKNETVELLVGEEDTEEKIILGYRDDYYSEDLINASTDDSVFPTEIISETMIETGTGELRRIFRPHELTAISKRLFDNDKKELNVFFRKLEECNSWDEAIDKMKELFIEKKVDPYNSDVLLFVDVLEEHYNKRV